LEARTPLIPPAREKRRTPADATRMAVLIFVDIGLQISIGGIEAAKFAYYSCFDAILQDFGARESSAVTVESIASQSRVI